MLRIAAGLEPAGNEAARTRDLYRSVTRMIVSGFGGLRTCEAFRRDSSEDSVKWSDVYFENVDESHLKIRETVAKTGRDRGIDMAPAVEAMKAWLALVP
jgi:hypothetical protein